MLSHLLNKDMLLDILFVQRDSASSVLDMQQMALHCTPVCPFVEHSVGFSATAGSICVFFYGVSLTSAQCLVGTKGWQGASGWFLVYQPILLVSSHSSKARARCKTQTSRCYWPWCPNSRGSEKEVCLSVSKRWPGWSWERSSTVWIRVHLREGVGECQLGFLSWYLVIHPL